jgi:hypothetical protein
MTDRSRTPPASEEEEAVREQRREEARAKRRAEKATMTTEQLRADRERRKALRAGRSSQ